MNNWYLLAAIPVFGLLIVVHELGHFLTAKWAGIRVEEFGLGLPPAIVGFRKRDRGGWEVLWFGQGRDLQENTQTPLSGASGGVSAGAETSQHTIYSLNLLPIGGFVRMPGETGDMYDAEGHYDEGSFAAKSAGKRIIVLCAGVLMNVILAMILFTVAYTTGEPTFPPVIGQVQAGSPASQAGLKANDKIISINGQSVASFDDVVTQVDQAITNSHAKSGNVPVRLQVQHKGMRAPVAITVNAQVSPPANQGHLGVVRGPTVFVHSPAWQAPFKGIVQTFTTTRQFLVGIEQMIVGAIQPQLLGPVGIVKLTGQVAQSTPDLGLWPILNFTAILSLNLAIVNILPFPALDGGRVVLVLIEVLRGGKRLKPEREGIINLVGMALLLTLMVAITVSDVVHWGG
ncbi:MAG TPA: M50 family metallopeptidase [Ktedonobacteraceae bacterium]|jgi:regulator of sigma E protease|nr:M50 family metallopeptidase [Ktedonobacteraceae bacterium]